MNTKPTYEELGQRIKELENNIDHHKSTVKSLQNSEQYLKQIINFLPDPAFVIDIGGRVIFWNKAIENLLNVKSKDIIGKGNYEYSLHFYNERRPILIDLALKPQDEWDKEYNVINKQGDIVSGEAFIPSATVKNKTAYFWGVATPLYNLDGEVFGAIECIRDISKRKLAQEERDKLIIQLQNTLDEVKTLRGILPICAKCKKIRDDHGYWKQIESYITEHSEAEFSHGICRECAKLLYPDLVDDNGNIITGQN